MTTDGKPVALVTGASSGIGAVFARKLAGRGYRVLLVARRLHRLQQLAQELGDAEPLATDLGSDSDVAQLERRVSREERLEFLVNNAGFGTKGVFWETDPAAQELMHKVHVLATMRLTRAALPRMVERGTGTIVNVSSVAAFYHNPRNVSYGATKAWMNSFSEGLYVELKAAGSPVKVQCVCPGFTYTEFHDVLRVDRRAIPKWMWMSAEEVVEASVKGLERNRLFVIPGWQYRLAARSQRWLPEGLRHALAMRYGNRTRRPADQV